MNYTGPSQKNTPSIVYMLQRKVLHFHYFILEVPCSLKFFGWRRITIIILRYQSHHLFYQDRVKKTLFLIFQLTFVQDSQMLLLLQVQTIVTQFWYMNWCVQFLKIITSCANTGNGWLHKTLHPVVWVYAARMVQNFSIPSAAIRCFQAILLD